MPRFKITHPWRDFVGIFEADDPDRALDAAIDTLARSMGYRNATRACLAGSLSESEMNVERVHDDGSTEQIFPCY